MDADELELCDMCRYPYPAGDGCDNPACFDNPRLSHEARQAIVERAERYHAQQARDAERRRLYAQSFAR